MKKIWKSLSFFSASRCSLAWAPHRRFNLPQNADRSCPNKHVFFAGEASKHLNQFESLGVEEAAKLLASLYPEDKTARIAVAGQRGIDSLRKSFECDECVGPECSVWGSLSDAWDAITYGWHSN